MGSLSWASKDDATVNFLGKESCENQENEVILLVKKLSNCSHYIGTVKIYCPKCDKLSEHSIHCTCSLSTLFCVCKKETVNLHNGFALYQILDIITNLPVADFHIEINPEDLREVETNAVGQEFRFPVAISTNLCQLSILRTVYRIGTNQQLAQQDIDLSINVLQRWPRRVSNLGHPRSKFYRLEFSACSNYLAVARRDRPRDKSYFEDIDIDTENLPEGFWSITIWKRETVRNHSQKSPLWKLMTGASTYGNFLVEGSFAFNLKHTLRVLREVGKEDSPPSHERTVIFDFGKQTQGVYGAGAPEKIMIYGSPLDNLHFSPCGRYLFGDLVGWSSTLRMVDIMRLLHGTTIIPEPENLAPEFYRLPMTTSLMKTKALMIQNTNALKITCPNRVPQLSTLRKYDGTLVHKRLTANIEEEKVLLYLPATLHANVSVSVLDDSEGDHDQIRMIVVNNPRVVQLGKRGKFQLTNSDYKDCEEHNRL